MIQSSQRVSQFRCVCGTGETREQAVCWGAWWLEGKCYHILCLPDGSSVKSLYEGWEWSCKMQKALQMQRLWKLSLRYGRGTSMMLAAIFTTNCRLLRSFVLQLMYQRDTTFFLWCLFKTMWWRFACLSLLRTWSLRIAVPSWWKGWCGWSRWGHLRYFLTLYLLWTHWHCFFLKSISMSIVLLTCSHYPRLPPGSSL